MITISKERFKEIQKGQYPLEKTIIDHYFNGIYYPAGSIFCGFKGTITGDFTSCALMFEHIHFEIEK